MKAFHKKRVRKLIAFLRQLPPRKFNFNRVVSNVESNGHVCGTVCCAVGWTPAVFPRLVGWAEDYLREYGGSQSSGLTIRGNPDVKDYPEVAEFLFGIRAQVADVLFAPNCQYKVNENLPKCSVDATPKQVAAMLEKFLALQP